MKKIILFALLAVVALQAGAQTRTNSQTRTATQTTSSYFSQEGGALGVGVYIIPQIGFNGALLTGMSDLDAKMRPGMNVGVMAEFVVSPSFSIQPGIFYSMQGTKIKKSVSILEGELAAHLDYVNIPIYAKAYVYQGLYFFAGPQFGFNTRAKLHGSANIIGIKADGDLADLKDYVNSFDFSVGLGAGYQDPSGFMISANYNIGLTNVMKDDAAGAISSYLPYVNDTKNGVLQINIGYRF